MKRFTIFIFAFITHALLSYNASATVVSNGTGPWNSISTWLVNGVPGLPASGDTILIRAGDVVSVTTQITYNGLAINLTIAGSLGFTTGNKLNLPCNSFINILDGGVIFKIASGGGNSTLISICNTTYWNAGMGPLTGPVVLPVTLLYFDAQFNGKEVDLSWATASEINNDYFIVQRSIDEIKYRDVTSIAGAGNSSSILYYSAIDQNIETGIYYYRLCQVDYDGTKRYYDPVVVSVNGKGNIIIYPNPSTLENLSILFDGIKDVSCDFEIVDITGKTIIQKENFLLHTGPNNLGLIGNLNSGTYIISVRKSEQDYHQVIMLTK